MTLKLLNPIPTVLLASPSSAQSTCYITLAESQRTFRIWRVIGKHLRIEYHFVKSGPPSPKTRLCSADIFLNIHVLILYLGCNETEINATNECKQLAKHSKEFKGRKFWPKSSLKN